MYQPYDIPVLFREMRKLNDKDVKDKNLMLGKKETPETISPDYSDNSLELDSADFKENTDRPLNFTDQVPVSV